MFHALLSPPQLCGAVHSSHISAQSVWRDWRERNNRMCSPACPHVLWVDRVSELPLPEVHDAHERCQRACVDHDLWHVRVRVHNG